MLQLFKIWRTTKHLRFRQIFFRIYYMLKGLLCSRFVYWMDDGQREDFVKVEKKIFFIATPKSFQAPITFTFLNIRHTFSPTVDWNYNNNRKLWNYNLNYFDFLLQKDLTREDGLKLITQYINNISQVTYGNEPYPTSLRIINWVKFCLKHQIHDKNILQSIHGQLKHLSNNLEYHILANHLLENAFALCVGSMYCNDQVSLLKGKKLVSQELEEQILSDGAHYERSPMYHQIILFRLLDLINIANVFNESRSWVEYLRLKAEIMLGYINQISFYGKDLPLFNDAAFKITADTQQLLFYGAQLGLCPQTLPLSESGFRKFKGGNWELLINVGIIMPSYQPGHSHADTFSFELYVNGKPEIVDTGTSTYEPGERRSLERGTKSHNTVSIKNEDSSEVWASHRVGRRAKVYIQYDESHLFEAYHDGYVNYGLFHSRKLVSSQNGLVITDRMTQKGRLKTEGSTTARLHFHPNVSVNIADNCLLVNDSLRIKLTGSKKIKLSKYLYAPEFNILLPALCCEIVFVSELITEIIVKE